MKTKRWFPTDLHLFSGLSQETQLFEPLKKFDETAIKHVFLYTSNASRLVSRFVFLIIQSENNAILFSEINWRNDNIRR